MYGPALGDDLTPNGTVEVEFGSFLVRSSGKTLLIDTGMGNKRGSPGGRLLDILNQLGVRPGDRAAHGCRGIRRAGARGRRGRRRPGPRGRHRWRAFGSPPGDRTVPGRPKRSGSLRENASFIRRCKCLAEFLGSAGPFRGRPGSTGWRDTCAMIASSIDPWVGSRLPKLEGG